MWGIPHDNECAKSVSGILPPFTNALRQPRVSPIQPATRTLYACEPEPGTVGRVGLRAKERVDSSISNGSMFA
jgi:hypothetical protein